MQEVSVWKVQKNDGAQYVAALLEFLLPEFSRIFGVDTMTNEECIVFNDPEADCPMLIINFTPVRIRLAQPSLSFWAQTIFQLSHELCHYAIRQHKINKDFTLSWFEEIICEAMSLYALHWVAENWDRCKLSQVNPQFANSIESYLTNELNSVGDESFRKCTSLDLLIEYEKEHSADRQTHRNERNSLFSEIVQAPEECVCFCDYCRYLDGNGVTINFARWEKDDNRKMVRVLHALQPYIPEKR